jgi:hypothetical protein
MLLRIKFWIIARKSGFSGNIFGFRYGVDECTNFTKRFWVNEIFHNNNWIFILRRILKIKAKIFVRKIHKMENNFQLDIFSKTFTFWADRQKKSERLCTLSLNFITGMLPISFSCIRCGIGRLKISKLGHVWPRCFGMLGQTCFGMFG